MTFDEADKRIILTSSTEIWPEWVGQLAIGSNNIRWIETLKQVGGGTNKLEARHIIPFHINPKLELDLNNLITPRTDASDGVVCHLAIGHLGTYKLFNQKIKNRP
jgi:hypothetical protein